MVASIRQSFRISYRSQLRGKLRNFRQRHWWRYLLASLLLSWAHPSWAGNFWLTWGSLFLGLCALAVASSHLSSYLQRDKQVFEADVEFQEARIVVWPVGGGPAEIKAWSWLLAAEESHTYFYLLIRRFPRLSLLLPKAALTPEETATLRAWLTHLPQKPLK